MERIAISFFVLLSTLGIANAQSDSPVVPGVITASNVDVTADDGSLLSERLGVGDMVYIVLQPPQERKGWVRITRSPEDTVGFGWVETKNIQRFAAYHATGGSSDQPTYTSPSYDGGRGRGGVAVLPFAASEPSDSYATTLFKSFSAALQAKPGLKIVTNLSGGGLDMDSSQALGQFLIERGLDGVIVGKLSSPFGGNRLLQLKYLGKNRGSFTIEKVKRLPVGADAQPAMKELANIYAASLSR